MILPRRFRQLLKLLLSLALLWQVIAAPVAASAGCCEGEPACCRALLAGAGCVTCVSPVLADTAKFLAPLSALVDGSSATLTVTAWISNSLHDIWRPPRAVT